MAHQLSPLQQAVLDHLQAHERSYSASEVATTFGRGLTYDQALSILRQLEHKGILKRVPRWIPRERHPRSGSKRERRAS